MGIRRRRKSKEGMEGRDGDSRTVAMEVGIR